ncbi:MAG: hypothetical protein GFH27_549347n40 [Chloroflexi bacterium AL-W]|nr:hypothetical protein [Chloroflexi bacterium AL-N1]NOK70822.1 hypothetical protein [Chloroflexi bacterium AL-N10]NOK78382.1 hypothetical protein [Chloroflexi bacterium AL-N5]NOK85363.1 hypothetical protein [Chloroflexi bacterium AL-W]NOK92639.1 hypothetical protein [Chloroflexi bacterium AL-N15]
MPLVPFQTEYRSSVQHIHTTTFGAMNLASLRSQPCTQIESLNKTCLQFVYQDGAVLKRYVVAYQLDSTHFRLNLLVAPQHTGHGIGTRLLQCIEEHVRGQGGKYLQLRVLEQMKSSLTSAISKGFREIHRMRSRSLYIHTPHMGCIGQQTGD